MKPKMSFVTLGVTDMERALRFYRDGLGFETHNHHPDDEFVFLKLEGTWLALATEEAFVMLQERVEVPAEATMEDDALKEERDKNKKKDDDDDDDESDSKGSSEKKKKDD